MPGCQEPSGSLSAICDRHNPQRGVRCQKAVTHSKKKTQSGVGSKIPQAMAWSGQAQRLPMLRGGPTIPHYHWGKEAHIQEVWHAERKLTDGEHRMEQKNCNCMGTVPQMQACLCVCWRSVFFVPSSLLSLFKTSATPFHMVHINDQEEFNLKWPGNCHS